MNSQPITLAGPKAEKAQTDYEKIQKILSYLSSDWQEQPSLASIAAHAGMSPTACHKLFHRWAGLTPKEFLQVLTVDHARKMLRASASVLETTYETGLSGPGRLHDLFIDHEAMTPGEYKTGGAGLSVACGVHPSPFGLAAAMATTRGLCGLAFADDESDIARTMEDMKSRWPNASYHDAPEKTAPYVQQIFSPDEWTQNNPIKVILIGTDFEIRVWQNLLKIPMGAATSYSQIAKSVCTAKAARAVGRAVGRNPLSFVVPCHRVLRIDGGLGGYHWGITRKKAIIGWEAGRLKNS